MKLLLGLYLCIGMAAATGWSFGKPNSGAITFRDGSGIVVHVLGNNKANPKQLSPYRYDHYTKKDGQEYAQEFHGPRPANRLNYDETISAGAHLNSIPFASDIIFVQAEERTSRNGPSQSLRTAVMPVNVPEKCKLEGICEDVPDYPQELVDRLLSEIGNTTRRFIVDELEPVEFTQRLGAPEEIELCSFQERIIVPRAAPDETGKWYHLVNQKEKPVQALRVEICQSSEAPCSDHAQFTYGYKAYCKQKYTLRKMAAIGENSDMIDKTFSIPSCCSCVLKPSS